MYPKIVAHLMFTDKKFHRQSAWTEKGQVYKKIKTNFTKGVNLIFDSALSNYKAFLDWTVNMYQMFLETSNRICNLRMELIAKNIIRLSSLIWDF